MLTGKVTLVRGHHMRQAIQLLVDQGCQVPWDGVSGSAVCCGDRVVGVITEMTDGANTGWAASVSAVRSLLYILDDPDLLLECQELLLGLYLDVDPLLALAVAFDLPPRATGQDDLPTDPRVGVEQLLRRAAQEGAAGLCRLVELARRDHPGNPRLGEFLARLQALPPGE